MNDIDYRDLCNRIALKVGNHATPHSADVYLKSLYKVILEELKLNKRIYLKGFGYFIVKERKSGERRINDLYNHGQETIVYVPPRLSITFKPSSILDKSINENNFKRITDKGIKRLDKEKKRKRTTTIADILNSANSRKGIGNDNGKTICSENTAD